MQIGPHTIDPPLILAPMAGVTDKPFRVLCRRMGAGYAVSEMVASNPSLRGTRKSAERMDHAGESAPIGVQIAGSDPLMLSEAARYNVDRGAEIIDINMGCPAKKVCGAAAGSALLRDEALVGRILESVVGAVAVPVTLKIRTGWSAERRNALAVARIAEDTGVSALAVHGRTREMFFAGDAEHETTAEIKARVRIPVIANGDIASAEQARRVLERTRADGLMIGRAAQGRPWIFREIAEFLATGRRLRAPEPETVCDILVGHVRDLHAFYGEARGVRIARKHLGWYAKGRAGESEFLGLVNRAATAAGQTALIVAYFDRLAAIGRTGLAA